MEISFIIVNYQSELFLKKCLRSITEKIGTLSHEIIVVNNDPSELNMPLENVLTIHNKTNTGFAKSCNLGSRSAKGRILFFLNPDTEIKICDIEKLLSKLDEPGTGIVAPHLIDPSDNFQSWSTGNEINLWTILRNNFNFFKNKQQQTNISETEIDWVSGAAMAISRNLFCSLDGFDEKFFMYFEDIDLCKRVKMIGKKITLVSTCIILHHGGQSYADKQRQKRDYYASQDYYFKKHFGSISLFVLKFLRSVSLFFIKF